MEPLLFGLSAETQIMLTVLVIKCDMSIIFTLHSNTLIFFIDASAYIDPFTKEALPSLILYDWTQMVILHETLNVLLVKLNSKASSLTNGGMPEFHQPRGRTGFGLSPERHSWPPSCFFCFLYIYIPFISLCN